MTIINIRHGKYLITLDKKLKQIRILRDFKNMGKIDFIEYGSDINFLFDFYKENDLKTLFSCLKEDLSDYIRITIKKCEVLKW